MLKVPKLKGTFVCGPCNNGKAGYTAVEHRISYLLPRKDHTVTINGLFASCDTCGKYARIPDIEEYNAALAAEAYENPALNLDTMIDKVNEDVTEGADSTDNGIELEVGEISLATTSEVFKEAADGQIELSSFISGM